MCKKRKGIMPKCLQIINEVLNDPNSTPRQRDGALHMVGAITDILLKKDQFKDQFDTVVIQYVFPTVSQPFGFLRYRTSASFNRSVRGLYFNLFISFGI